VVDQGRRRRGGGACRAWRKTSRSSSEAGQPQLKRVLENRIREIVAPWGSEVQDIHSYKGAQVLYIVCKLHGDVVSSLSRLKETRHRAATEEDDGQRWSKVSQPLEQRAHTLPMRSAARAFYGWYGENGVAIPLGSLRSARATRRHHEGRRGFCTPYGYEKKPAPWFAFTVNACGVSWPQ